MVKFLCMALCQIIYLKFYRCSMLYLSKPKKVYLYLEVVDFRKQINGLSQIIDLEFPKGSLLDSWFVFISRNRKQVKIVYWRSSGLCLWQYRLEKEKFTFTHSRNTIKYGISWQSLKRFLDGFNIFEGEAHEIIKPKRNS